MRNVACWLGLAFAAAGGGVACGEAFTSTGGAGAGSTSSGAAGAGGRGTSSASASASSSADTSASVTVGVGSVSSSSSASSSSGGPMSCSGTCGSGTYCNPLQGACVACANFARFHFGDAFKLDVTLPGAGTARFPRVASDGSLFLSYTAGGNSVLASAGYAAFPAWDAAVILSSPPNPPTSPADALGPLELKDGAALKSLKLDLGTGPVLLFDLPSSGGTTRQVLAYEVGSSSMPVAVPLPGASATKMQWRIAVAPDIVRAWWLETGGATNAAALMTASLASSSSATVTVKLDDGNASFPNQPWVSLDGTILLVSATYAPPSLDTTEHLFFARLSIVTGMTIADAQRIYPADASDADGDPSLSSDGCALLFTRNGELFGALRD